MLLLVGLGNPAPEYDHTRHNTGFMAIEYLHQNLSLPNVTLQKSNEFMNNSGVAIKKLVEYYKVNLDDLYIIHDDLDLPLGEYKIQHGVGPKVHGGINSIGENLGSNDFWRIRIGIDSRDPLNRIDGEAYVLQNFTAEEKKVLGEVFEKLKIDLSRILN